MGHFLIIVNGFQLFTTVAKSSVLNVVGFLDTSLHRNKFAAKQSAGSNLNRQLYIHAYLYRKYLHKVEKHMFWNPILFNLQHYNHSSLSYNHIQVYRVYRGKQSLWFLFSDKFPTFRWKLQHYCVASSASILAHFFKMKIL